jgi:hypothetical protein
MALAQAASRPATDAQTSGVSGNKPLIQERVIFTWHNFLSSCSTWDLEDWLKWVAESHTMGYNTIMVHAYANNPMGAFTFQGKQREVGYLASSAKGRDWNTMHVSDVRRIVGGDKLFDGPVFASKAARVPGEKRVESAQELMRQVFADAGRRGMGVNFAYDFDTDQGNPQELIMLLPESARFKTEDGRLWLANPDTPEGYGYYKAAVSNWMKAYPQITKIVVFARYGETAWSSLNKAMPADWRKEYEELTARKEYQQMIAQFPKHKKQHLSSGFFCYAKVVKAVEKALKECGATNTQVAIGTWGFLFLPSFDAFLPKHIAYYGIDYDSLYGNPQLGTPERRAPLKLLGGSRPLIPVSWAHHDDGRYIGRPFTPFSDFTAKLNDAKVAGFGDFHWMTRPLDLYFYSHTRQVFSATQDEPLQKTCEWYATHKLGEPELSQYLYEWVTKAPIFGRDTSDFVITDDVLLTNKQKVIAGCRERMKLLEKATGKNAAYFRALEDFCIAFYEAQTKYQECLAAYRQLDLAAARAAIMACNPEEAVRKYAACISIGETTKGEKGYLITLNTRWLVYFYRMRQILGVAPVRINFGPTSHEKLAQSPGRFTYHFDAETKVWQTLGTEETKVKTFSAPKADHELGRSGLIGDKPFTVEAGPLAHPEHPGELPAGNYRLKLLFLDTDSTAEGQRVFKVTAQPVALTSIWTFEPIKAAYLRLKCQGRDNSDWNTFSEVKLAGLLRSETNFVTASAAAEGCPVKHLVDGIPDTRWAAQGRDQWVKFRLDPKVAVNRIGLAWPGGDSKKPIFAIETSDDDANWTPVSELQPAGKNSDAEVIVDVFKKAGRKNHLVEMELPVALKTPGIFRITLTPVKGEAVISGLVLETL